MSFTDIPPAAPVNTIYLLLSILNPPTPSRTYDAPLIAGEALARHWMANQPIAEAGDASMDDRTYVERESFHATVTGLARIARDVTFPMHRARAAAALLSMGVIDLPAPAEVTP